MDNCQRGCAIEPDTSTSCNSSDFTSEDNLNKSTATVSKKKTAFSTSTLNNKEGKKATYKKNSKINKALNDDPTKELISYLKGERERQQ